MSGPDVEEYTISLGRRRYAGSEVVAVAAAEEGLPGKLKDNWDMR